jgi:nucleoside diphosphate kinase
LRFEQRGLHRPLGAGGKVVHWLKRHYDIHRGKPFFFEGLVGYMASSSVVIDGAGALNAIPIGAFHHQFD